MVITQPAASLELLTRKQAAHLLGIGLKTLDRLVRDGHIVRLRMITAAYVNFLLEIDRFLGLITTRLRIWFRRPVTVVV